jgi:hypothetical protein
VRTRTRVLAGASLLVLVLGIAACGGGDDDASDGDEPSDDTTTTEVAEESTTTAEPTPEDQAIDAYMAAYDYFAALNPPNPQSADLMRLFSGEALATMIDTIFRARNEGVYVEGSFEMHPEVTSSTDVEVHLADCVVETNTTYDAATGEERDSGRYVHNRRATVVNVEGAWSVSAFEQSEESCTPQGG